MLPNREVKTAGRSMIYLIVLRGTDAPLRISVQHFPVSIGRDSSCTLRLTDPETSRKHVIIKRRESIFVIADCNSRNGCHVNGERIINATIQNGDKITLGNTEILFATSIDSISFSPEISRFNMIIDRDMGICGPITVDEQPLQITTPAVRLGSVNVLNQTSEIVRKPRQVLESYANLLPIDILEEAAQCALTEMAKIVKIPAKMALFVWQSATRQLAPVATHLADQGSQNPFVIHSTILQRVVNRRQGYVVSPTSKNREDRHILVLPMFKGSNLIAVVHIEYENIHKPLPSAKIKLLQLLSTFFAPKFETLLLRREIDSMFLGMVEAMVATIEAKDTYTVGHSERVCKYSMAIADSLGLQPDVKKMLMTSALCHDIGKIGIPDSILKKAALLSTEEYEEMKLHPTIGADIMSNLPNAQKFLSGIKYHHEKWDGTGYPDGLEGEDIPFFGRIVAVADAFDAMVSGRSYSGFIDESEAIEKIQNELDLFDPEIVAALVRAWEDGSVTQRTSTIGKPDSSDNP